MDEMNLHCIICDKPLGTFLYGEGGVAEKSEIKHKFVKVPIYGKNCNIVGKQNVSFGLPDVTCFKCLKTKVILHGHNEQTSYTGNMNLQRERILDFIHRCESVNLPKLYIKKAWEMDRKTLHLLRTMHDKNHNYDWKPDLEHSTRGTFFNIGIVIIKDKGLTLKYVYPENKIVRIEILDCLKKEEQ